MVVCLGSQQASRAAPQAAGVKPSLKHVKRNGLKRDLNTEWVGKPYNRYLRGHGVVDEKVKVTSENQFSKNIMRKLVAATLGNVVLPHRIPLARSFVDPIRKK